MSNLPKIAKELAEKTLKELNSPNSPLNSPKTSYNSPNISSQTPFRIPTLEKTTRQSPSGKSYRFSAVYRNAVTLRLLVQKFTNTLNPQKYFRFISQINDAARSVVANIREGYKRPTTKEYLDFLGYSQASLEEVRGDIEDAKDDGLLPSKPGSSLASIGIHLKPHPYYLLKSPNISYDPLGEIKRVIGDIKGKNLTYEIFLELINKTDYLLKRTVEGLQTKIVQDEKAKLNQQLETIYRRHW